MKDDDNKSKISQNPTAKDMLALLPLVQLLGRGAGFAAKIGIKREAMENFKKLADELADGADLLHLPDRFNEAFASEGWVATGAFSVDVMRKAVDLDAQGKRAEAEDAILGWFNEENIRLFAITRARRFHVAQLRDEQLEEALKLFIEERYMAAVPLILIACDGFASDVSGLSPFEKNADLTCFDSIAGHQTSLPALMRLFIQGVRKSTDEELSLPKRHGILHGRSLGYANKLVCAKAWLLMVALVDWAIDKRSEEARIAKQREKEETSFSEVLEKSRRVQADKILIAAFQPSTRDGPFEGPLDAGTPEFALTEFLDGWKKRNFGQMVPHSVNLTKKSAKKMAGEIRDIARDVTLEEFEIKRLRLSTVARCEARVKLRAKTFIKVVDGDFDVVFFRYTADGDVAMPTDADGIWAIALNLIGRVMTENYAKDD